MTETLKNGAQLRADCSDPSWNRDLLASVEGCYGWMHTAGQPVTGLAVTTSYATLAGFTVAGSASGCTIDATNGTITLSGAASAGLYLVFGTLTTTDAGESDVVYIAIHRGSVEQPQARSEATVTATLEVSQSFMGIVSCPAGTEVLTLKIKGAAGMTGNAWIGSWGCKRL